MARTSERDEALVEVAARLKNYSLSPCLDCGGQGYTDQGKSACFWCRGAGVITQQMAHAFGVADRAEASLATATSELARLRAEGEALKGALKPFSAGGKWGVWLAWIVNGAPDREQGKAAAKQIVQWRAAVDIALSPNPTAEAPKPAADAPWPSGCIKPNACARHRQCVYAMSAEKCRHFGQNLGPAIEAADAARAATAREG